MPKKKTTKKATKKKSSSINIKVDNLDKIAKACKDDKKKKWNCGGGSGFWVFGSAFAMVLSYTQNSSIWWALLHGILSWFYVIYRIIVLYI